MLQHMTSRSIQQVNTSQKTSGGVDSYARIFVGDFFWFFITVLYFLFLVFLFCSEIQKVEHFFEKVEHPEKK